MASQTVQHLLEAMKCLSSNAKFKPILSNMLSKSRTYDTFPNSPITDATHCLACGINFADVLPKQYLLPSKKCNRFLRRQLKYQQFNTKYQMESLSKLKKNGPSKRTLIKKCQSCGKEYRIKIYKPEHVLTSKIERINKRKKQKKKKSKQKSNEISEIKTSVVSSTIKGTKRKRADSEIILIETPKTPDTNLVSTQNENEIIQINNTPTPKRKRSANSDVILLDTPVNKTNDNVIVIEDTPNTSTKKNFNNKFKSSGKTKSWRYFSDQNTEKAETVTPKSKKKKCKKSKSPKTPNVVLASAKKTKQKKLNTLSDIFSNKSNNFQGNKPDSNLQHFLKSITQ